MMQKKVNAALCTLWLLGAGAVLPAHAADPAHHHHETQGSPVTLSLDAGKRWHTDAPLRQAMGNIHDALTQALPKVHANTLGAEGYQALATRIDTEVAYMVSHCRLAPEADAQLHLVIAEIVSGAEVMRGKQEDKSPRSGVLRVKQALGLYATYFDDPAFIHRADEAGH